MKTLPITMIKKVYFNNKAAEECVLEDTDGDKSVSDDSTYNSDSDSPYGIPYSFKILGKQSF